MFSYFVDCFHSWHVSDKDDITAAPAAASHSAAPNQTATVAANATATPAITPTWGTALSNDSSEDDVSNTFVVEKAVPSSPSQSLVDKTFASASDELDCFIRNHDVENESTRRKKMLIAKNDCNEDYVSNIIFVEKAVPSSPCQSILDKTFASSSDESDSLDIYSQLPDQPEQIMAESSQGDKEAGGFIRNHDVGNESRRRKKMLIAKYCFIALMIVSILIVLFVGGSKKEKLLAVQEVTMNPSSSPSSSPSISPTHTNFPSLQPTSFPSAFPSAAPFVLFTYGESLYRDNALDIQISVGLTARQIAQTGSRVSFANGGQSSIRYHGMMDGAGIAPLPNGGYAYLSNAEEDSGRGGVYGLYFNKNGEITDYKALLTGTSRNCGGGMSPWNTWISCEEVSGGQCWQVEPDPSKPNHYSPEPTLLGGPDGGEYETVAVDNTNKSKPIFFTTEDNSNGELRRFEADGNGWDALHQGGQTSYLEFLDGNRFQWTTDITAGENSAAQHYPNAEGIIYHNSTLYFVAKVTRTLFILDLNDMTYTSEVTGSSWVGQGAFNSQPDQIIENDLDERKFIYFTEDGGKAPGVHVRDREGKYYTLARGVPGGRYSGDETVGIAFSPDRKKFYFGFQDAGVLIEVTRDDGHKFN